MAQDAKTCKRWLISQNMTMSVIELYLCLLQKLFMQCGVLYVEPQKDSATEH